MGGRRSYVEKAYMSVLDDPAASPESKVKAAAGLERVRNLRVRTARRQKQEAAAAQPEAATKPRPELDEDTIRELERRGAYLVKPDPAGGYVRELDLDDGKGRRHLHAATPEEMATKIKAELDAVRPGRCTPDKTIVCFTEN